MWVLRYLPRYGVDDRGGVVVDARLILLVDRRDDHHPVLRGLLLEELRRRAVGDLLGVGVALGVLDLAEVRAVEELLQADRLHPLLRGGVDVPEMPLDHRVLGPRPGRLDERRLHRAHVVSPSGSAEVRRA